MKKQYNVGYFTSRSDVYLDNVKQALIEKGVADENISNDKLGEVIKSLKLGRVKALFDAKKSCYYEFYNQNNITYEQLAEILSYDDTSEVTSMYGMFYNCENLTTIPQLNTSKVTSMNSMFYHCYALKTIPLIDTSKVTIMNSMFYGCTKLEEIGQLDTSKVTNMSNMFYNCSSLITIPPLDVSSVTNFNSVFYNCSKLESILMTGMKATFTISYSTKLTREALVTILNNLATVTSTQKLTMGSTNLAKLTDEDKAIATNKGWTLA